MLQFGQDMGDLPMGLLWCEFIHLVHKGAGKSKDGYLRMGNFH